MNLWIEIPEWQLKTLNKTKDWALVQKRGLSQMEIKTVQAIDEKDTQSGDPRSGVWEPPVWQDFFDFALLDRWAQLLATWNFFCSD